MDRSSWQNKFQVLEGISEHTAMTSDNSFGLLFKMEGKRPTMVYFKPLNDSFIDEVYALDRPLLVNFDREFIEEDDAEYALDVMALFNRSPFLRLDTADGANALKKILELLLAEYHGPSPSYIMLKSLVKVLFLQLIRIANQGFLLQEIDQKRVYQFLELMETHFMEWRKAEMYSDEMGIGPKRLNQILKSKLGLTANQIMDQRILTEAKRKLMEGGHTIKEIAFLLGFESLSSFSRFFKKMEGQSPSQYRALYS